MNPLLILNVAMALMEAVERGNSAVIRMRELRALAEAGELTEEHLLEVQARLEGKIKSYREGIQQ